MKTSCQPLYRVRAIQPVVALYYILNRLHNKTSCSHLPLSLFTSAGWYNDEHKEEEEEEENEEQDDDGMPPLSQIFLLTPQQMESSCNSKGKPVFVLASRERERDAINSKEELGQFPNNREPSLK